MQFINHLTHIEARRAMNGFELQLSKRLLAVVGGRQHVQHHQHHVYQYRITTEWCTWYCIALYSRTPSRPKQHTVYLTLGTNKTNSDPPPC